jgi:two-component system, OmpR family, sensor histidine kinase MprB
MSVAAIRKRRISFRARLGILVALAVGVTLALAALASYFAVRHQLLGQVDSALVSEAQNAQAIANDPANFYGQNSSSLLQFLTWTGQVFGQSNGAPTLPTDRRQVEVVLTHRYVIETVVSEGVRYREITVGGFESGSGPVAVQIARPLTDIEHSLSELRLILWLVTMGGVAVAVALGYLIGRATMRPVVRLTGAAQHVAATQDLDATIEVQGDDELASLAQSFNSMLQALAASRQQQAQLISDAGHELRTPLTSLRTNIEVLMRVPDLPDADRAELVGDVNAQLEELTTLIGDVVDLARADEQQGEKIEVRFDLIVARAVERARRRAPSVTFDVHLTPGSLRASPPLVERAVLNVLDNAAKWSPKGGLVSVWLQRGDRWTLDVHDSGPGIAKEDLPHVFDRFYRAESARSMPGSGLGLAIVRQVITDHGGTVTASSPPVGGTVIHIELPTVAEHEPESAGASMPPPAGQPYAAPQGAPIV